jgi:Zn-finger nucleic acid-binding protein
MDTGSGREGRDAVTLHCSSCGAPFPAGATICAHCSAEITLEERDLDALCGACGARMSRRARFCMRCGRAVPPQPVAPRPELAPCPRCKGTLRERQLEGGGPLAFVVECGSCGGLWLSPGTLDRLCADHEAAHSASAHLIRRPPPPLKIDTGKVSYLPCPECRDFMVRRNFGGSSGVIVDVCKNHGVWLDHAELEKVVDFARGGGLEAERRRELERLEREVRETKQRRIDAGAETWLEPRHHVMGYDLGDLFGDLLRMFKKRP